MYSARVNGEPTTFGTSGLLYRSNKLMYDRATKTIWHQFTGEPVIGPLANSGIELTFFPTLLTTWQEWLAEHPDTTVLSTNTGIYAPESYVPESNPRAIYYTYFNSPDTGFPVWIRSSALQTKAVVLGVSLGGESKAYPVDTLQRERVVNDTLGGVEIVVIASSESQAAKVYRRGTHRFSLDPDSETAALPDAVVDSDGVTWQLTEDHLVSSADPSQLLERLPTHMSFWFGWYEFHTDTKVYGQEGE